jgi:hypothetical protein
MAGGNSARTVTASRGNTGGGSGEDADQADTRLDTFEKGEDVEVEANSRMTAPKSLSREPSPSISINSSSSTNKMKGWLLLPFPMK